MGNSNTKIYLVLFVVVVIVGAIFTHVGPTIEQGAETLGPALPANFEIQENSSFINTKMSVVANGQTLGTVNEKANGNLMTFEYRDMSEKLIASAQSSNSTWVTTIDVWTNQGNKIGTFKEDIGQRGFASTVYSIDDASGNEIGSSKKTNGFFTSTRFRLTSDSGVALTTIQRTAQWPLDVWAVSVDHEGVDPRLLVMIAAFKTGEDNKKDD